MDHTEDYFQVRYALADRSDEEKAAFERIWEMATEREEIALKTVEAFDLAIGQLSPHFQTNIVREFMVQAGQNTPNTPIEPSRADRLLRANLILEESLELITKGLGVSVTVDTEDNYGADDCLKFENSSDFSLAIEGPFNIIETVDGAEDLRWVGVDGVYVMCGVSPIEPLEEVNRSNMSKFIDGHRREDGKWVKGSSYSPVDLNDKIKGIVNE